MFLWIGFAALTAGVIYFLVRPMMVAEGVATDAAEAELAVYRDQLKEVDSDLDRGLISSSEAEDARAELGRRLLARADVADDGSRDGAENASKAAVSAGINRGIAYGTAAVVPLVAVATYIAVGSPGLPARPHAERMNVAASEATVEELIGKIEAELRKNPTDGRGWEVLAPVYMRLQRFGDAANAYAQAIRLLGETPRRLAGFAEANIITNNGVVAEPARMAFERLLKIEPEHVEARFWLAQAREQDGDKEGALERYRAMLETAPKDAPWRGIVEQRVAILTGAEPGPTNAPLAGIAQGAQTGAGETTASPPRGPSAADMAAAQDMTQEQRSAFITQMVAGLADRLKKNGKDAEGWKRLIRAYAVLGKKDKAKIALGEAKRNFDGDAPQLAEFDTLAEQLGLGS